jgi:glycosyltransferase involved in cell wall biosynthesis
VKFLFLESFYGGSHRDFADGLIQNSRHAIDLVSLPARFWKWRMRGAALHFAHTLPSPAGYDGVIATGLMSISDLKALWGRTAVPVLLYLHENQLSYPLAPGESVDYQFGFTDITSALAADRVLFNSRSHHDAFIAALPGFIRMMPEHRPKWVVQAIRAKSGILYPGCRFDGAAVSAAALLKENPPLIIWNHRWEFDKNPEGFFSALNAVDRAGVGFRLALLGENFQAVPKAFISARRHYGRRIVCYGYEASRERYYEWLRHGTVVVSTARQENFGIAVVEAVRRGCFPLLPQRLSYPEIIPEAFHGSVLYSNRQDLVRRLTRLLRHPDDYAEQRRRLAAAMARFAWRERIADFDDELDALACKRT